MGCVFQRLWGEFFFSPFFLNSIYYRALKKFFCVCSLCSRPSFTDAAFPPFPGLLDATFSPNKIRLNKTHNRSGRPRRAEDIVWGADSLEVGNRGQGSKWRPEGTSRDVKTDLGLSLPSSGLGPHWWPPVFLRVEISDPSLSSLPLGISVQQPPCCPDPSTVIWMAYEGPRSVKMVCHRLRSDGHPAKFCCDHLSPVVSSPDRQEYRGTGHSTHSQLQHRKSTFCPSQ